MLFYKKCKLEK